MKLEAEPPPPKSLLEAAARSKKDVSAAIEKAGQMKRDYTITGKSRESIRAVFGRFAAGMHPCCNGLAMWLADRVATFIQLSMGITATVSAHTLAKQLHALAFAPATILLITITVQVCPFAHHPPHVPTSSLPALIHFPSSSLPTLLTSRSR